MEQVEAHTMRLLGTMPAGLMKSGANIFEPSDVLYGRLRSYLNKVYQPDFSGLCSGEFIVMPESCAVLGKYLKYRLNAGDFVRFASRINTGDRPRVDFDQIKAFTFLLPPKREQERIADALDELLSDLDTAVAALERVKEKLKLYRASVLKAAVEGSLTAEWRAQHPRTEPAAELLKRILTERRHRWEEDQLAKFRAKGKEPPKNWKAKYKEPVSPDTATLPPPPDGWCWASLSQLSWSAGYGTSVKCRQSNEGLPVLRIPNILGGKVDLDNLKFAPSNYSEHEEELIHAGDLLVVRTNGSRLLIGRGAIVRDEPVKKLSFASYLIRLRMVPDASMLSWFSVLWDSPHVRRWIEARAATSAGQFNINLGVLETLSVPFPPLAEQEAIVETVEDQLSVIEHLEADLDAKLKSAQSLRQSILLHAFSGQLVPQDPNDEPASELLKRIATEREARAAEARTMKRTNTIPEQTRSPKRARHKKKRKES
jgi:type I restriction enzyme S subunit